MYELLASGSWPNEPPVADRAPQVDEIAPPWRTLADISDAPPGASCFGMLEPDGPTLAYAAPGVGKGTTGAWLCSRPSGSG